MGVYAIVLTKFTPESYRKMRIKTGLKNENLLFVPHFFLRTFCGTYVLSYIRSYDFTCF